MTDGWEFWLTQLRELAFDFVRQPQPRQYLACIHRASIVTCDHVTRAMGRTTRGMNRGVRVRD